MSRQTLSIIGFGEAAQAFADSMDAAVTAYDRKTDDPALRAGKHAEAARIGVTLADTSAGATSDAVAILSLVTADQALAAAEANAPHLAAGALYCDMNSVAPATKRAAAAIVEQAGGRYVDVAVMAPVHPARRRVPLLVGGPHAEPGASLLRGLGFEAVRALGGDVGAASSIKMIRSIMVKGIEALTTECMLSAEAAGVRDEVIASLDASWPGADWGRRGDYNLDRMMIHGLRRADEMDEVVRTIEGLGLHAAMSRGTVARQREIGRLGLAAPDGLDAKLDLLRPLFTTSTNGTDA